MTILISSKLVLLLVALSSANVVPKQAGSSTTFTYKGKADDSSEKSRQSRSDPHQKFHMFSGQYDDQNTQGKQQDFGQEYPTKKSNSEYLAELVQKQLAQQQTQMSGDPAVAEGIYDSLPPHFHMHGHMHYPEQADEFPRGFAPSSMSSMYDAGSAGRTAPLRSPGYSNGNSYMLPPQRAGSYISGIAGQASPNAMAALQGMATGGMIPGMGGMGSMGAMAPGMGSPMSGFSAGGRGYPGAGAASGAGAGAGTGAGAGAGSSAGYSSMQGYPGAGYPGAGYPTGGQPGAGGYFSPQGSFGQVSNRQSFGGFPSGGFQGYPGSSAMLSSPQAMSPGSPSSPSFAAFGGRPSPMSFGGMDTSAFARPQSNAMFQGYPGATEGASSMGGAFQGMTYFRPPIQASELGNFASAADAESGSSNQAATSAFSNYYPDSGNYW